MVLNNSMNYTLFRNETYRVVAVGSAATATGITIFLTLCNIVAFLSMFRTKRVPKAIRIFACSLVLSDLFAEVIYMISQIMLLSSHNENRCSIRDVRFAAIQCCLFISALTIVSLSLERMVVLYFSDAYIKYFNKKVFIIITLSNWVVGTVCNIIHDYIFPANYWQVCNPSTRTGLILEGRIISWIGYILLSLGILVPNYFIFRSVKTHLNQIHALSTSTGERGPNRRQMYKSTIAVSVLGLSFLVLNLPMITVMLVVQADTYHNISDKQKFQAFNIAFLFVQLHCLVNTVVYVWRFKECQLKFIEMFLSRSEYFRRKADEIRQAMALD